MRGATWIDGRSLLILVIGRGLRHRLHRDMVGQSCQGLGGGGGGGGGWGGGGGE